LVGENFEKCIASFEGEIVSQTLFTQNDVSDVFYTLIWVKGKFLAVCHGL